jgi:hypothetical protein
LTIGINDTGGKIAAGINDTGGKFASRWSNLSCEYLREFSKKIRNGPNGILWGWGETDL